MLKEVLHDAEAELKRRLAEACDAEARGISSDSASQIRELENALLAAAKAANKTLTIRRHIDQREVSGAHAEGEAARSDGETSASERENRVREFEDAAGQRWRAWPVTPGQARPGTALPYLGEFHKGWICFEALDTSARRRLPYHPPGWCDLAEPELVRLLDEAIAAPARKPRAQTSGSSDNITR